MGFEKNKLSKFELFKFYSKLYQEGRIAENGGAYNRMISFFKNTQWSKV